MLHSPLFPLENTALMVTVIELNDVCVSHGPNIDFINYEQTKQGNNQVLSYVV